jgi:hypothetical protein
MNTTIQVTAQHIKEGQPGSAQYCPVALAIRERIKPDPHVSLCVRFTFAYLVNDTRGSNPGHIGQSNVVTSMKLPQEVTDFIYQFDTLSRYQSPSPFEFQLEIPEECLKETA